MKTTLTIFIYTFLVLIFLFTCSPPEYKAPCDPTSKTFKAYILVKLALNDKNGFCNSTTNSGAGIAATTPVNLTVANPTFSPVAGNYLTPQNISISTTTAASSIYFTLNGTNPTSSSTLYSAALNIYNLAGLTIKAIATKTGLTDSTILTGVFSYPPVRTGQTTSYTAGDDVTNAAFGVTRSYTDNGDSTVTDNYSGLIWQKCSNGQTILTCTGGLILDTWVNQAAYCTGLSLAGKTWRLPSKFELQTIINYGVSNPSINSAVFPLTTANNYWSSTTFALNVTLAWGFNFVDGSNGQLSKATNNYVRCVSGAQKSETQNFKDNGNGTVSDIGTGLVWQQCSKDLTGPTCTGTSITIQWAAGITYCSGLSLAGRTWRLPNVHELSTITDLTLTVSPAINTTFFPNTYGFNYLSSTTYAPSTTYAFLVSFNGGFSSNVIKTSNDYVRCVSGP